MTKYHVGCGFAGIYAGTLKPNGIEWRNKSDVTKEALYAAAQYLLFDNKEVQFRHDNKTYVMKVEEVDEE